MSNRTSTRKVRKSYTLSPQSASFLEKLRKRRKARSTSAVLEEIVQEAQSAERREAYEAAVKAYYDSATDEDMAEEAAWGEFALQQLRSEDLD